MTTRISIGLAGTLPVETIVAAARAAEAAGLHALWLNEGPGGDSLTALAAAGAATERLLLGVGVVPLDHSPAAALAERLERAGLPSDRFVLGVGSGRAPHAAAFMAGEIRALRERVASPILVGALGPLVRRVGAELADGLLLNWLPPDVAAEAHELAVAQAAAADRPRPHVALYARTAVEAAAHAALRAEAERYAAFPSYAANFARLDRDPLDSAILATDAEGLRRRVAEYAGTVDELVLRVITADDTADQIRRVIDAAPATA